MLDSIIKQFDANLVVIERELANNKSVDRNVEGLREACNRLKEYQRNQNREQYSHDLGFNALHPGTH